jgi:N-acetyl-anhydromuramyl-L-alanine amidase AmpD
MSAATVTTRLSPHHGPRIGARPIRLIVLHADASASEAGTLSWFQAPASKVSYHVLIGRDGTRYRVVPDNRVAWHAGVSKHPSCQNPKSVNSESLGLSFSNRQDGHEPITAAQIAAAQAQIAEWKAAHPTIVAVATHAQVAPGRKVDPETAPNFRLSDFT